MLCPNSWPAHEIHAPSSALGIPLSQSSLLAELSGQLTSQHYFHPLDFFGQRHHSLRLLH
jgi:hypothetical protein